jgi:hypothetical protein
MYRSVVVRTLALFRGAWERSALKRVSVVALAFLMAVAPRPVPAQQPGAGDEQLRRELDAVKEQLRRVEEQMRQQQELIRKLSGERPAPPPPAVVAPPTPPPGPAPAAPTTVDAEELKQLILREIQPQLTAASKTFPSQFNPAIGFIVDTVFSSTRKEKSNFEFRSGEIGISADIDPFARAYAIINGTPDGVEVEEAAIVTTSLPWNLTVKGGRFFAEFGRLSTFHDHDLPFVNRPLVLDTYVGGESQADGVEVNWLVPIPHYLSITLGAYNKVGAENDRADNAIRRDPGEFTYLGRVATSFNLHEEHTLDIGVSDAFTPLIKFEGRNSRNLAGLDLTYRYKPLAAAGYRGFVWGNEFLVNREAFESESSPGTFRFKNAFGMYSYMEPRLTRRYYPGILFEYVQDIDRPSLSTKAISPYFTIWLSEFQRLRLQYTHTWSSNRSPDDGFFLQWTAIIGSHVHSFRDR